MFLKTNLSSSDSKIKIYFFPVRAIMDHKEVYENLFDLSAFNQMYSLKQFDEMFTIKMFGFKTLNDYYQEATNAYGLKNIKVPTFAISSADDLIAPEKDLPLEQIENECSHFTMLVTARGGHIGFMDGLLMPGFYLERLFQQYAEALFVLEQTPRYIFKCQ